MKGNILPQFDSKNEKYRVEKGQPRSVNLSIKVLLIKRKLLETEEDQE